MRSASSSDSGGSSFFVVLQLLDGLGGDGLEPVE
jgi:hypothetical protein